MLIGIGSTGEGELAQLLQEVLVVVIFILHNLCLSLDDVRTAPWRSAAR